eukprot:CAMPEP_0202713872 /NCGR_PEP_ID=MMETSP1385-20130828/60776_1 /ASSEMBLY_ACC=CAM_ASM_000861 /TAXON_ID=933848 /ORGANISM="Elphidium margaritaceum" /LENGTH=408 /DNA_ID=CAMNT_0049374411 /DNA_START=29 /DNA_END=1255 /DNA_ORIENTATION=-
MGSCMSPKSSPSSGDGLTLAEQEAHRTINDELVKHQNHDQRGKKLLLLGSGASGKSTLFRQVQCIYDVGFNETDHIKALGINRQNMVKEMWTLLVKWRELYEKNIVDSKLEDDQTNTDAVLKILEYKEESFDINAEYEASEMHALGASLALLWKLPAVRETFKLGTQYFAISENIDFFFDKAVDIFKPNYEAPKEDVVKSRLMTTGMNEKLFTMNDVDFLIVDVGGQRSERKKWITQFGGVNAILFVAALSHYNRVLFEDETRNGMHESISLFNEIINLKFFRTTEMILFLNKKDLFAKLIREQVPLSVCFSTDKGWDGQQWAPDNANDYMPSSDPDQAEEDEEEFTRCYNAALDFITTIYVEQNERPGKMVYVHVTDATDQDQIEKVFWDVQDIAIKGNLRQGGLIP